MKKLIINGVVGVVLFSGSLVGGLAATGRLNHEGVANIPLLNTFFPAPPATEGGEDGQGEPGTMEPGAAPGGEVANASHNGESAAADASQVGDGQDPNGAEGPRRTKIGRSVVNPEAPADDGHGGGDHGEADTGDGAADGHEKPTKQHAAEPVKQPQDQNSASHDAERDFKARELAMAQEKANKYAPGGYFTFNGMPSGLTPEQLNEAWQRVQDVLADLERRRTVLDLREQDLHELADDIGRRHLELGRMREELTNSQRDLDDRIAKFQEQVKLVRNDEVAALQRNAKTLESFEPLKAAELITEQWRTEQGQTEVLKTFEFMAKDKVNEIINELANPLIQDVLKKRLTVSKESAASKKRR